MASTTLNGIGRYVKGLCLTAIQWALQTSDDDVLVGGQAVLEGVMMRGPEGYAVAVRTPDGSVSRTSSPIKPTGIKWRLFRLPFVRGIGVLGQALVVGIRALKFSAEHALAEDNQATQKPKTDEPKSQNLFIAGNLVVALGINLVLFVAIPLILTRLIQGQIGFENFLVFNAVDGVLRVAVFLLFLYSVSRMEDMRRVFEYHGAEHKTVYAFEAHLDLTLDNARGFSTLHPRCGTSFLLIVMVVSILVFSLFHFDGFLAKLLSRIALMPAIAGISYEVIRYSARNPGKLARWIMLPGLMLQKITTNEPDDDQMEVAIVALEDALAVTEPSNG